MIKYLLPALLVFVMSGAGVYAQDRSGRSKEMNRIHQQQPELSGEKIKKPDSEPGDQTSNSYHFDSETGEFSRVPYSPEGVDSLISIGENLRNSDPLKAAHAILQALDLAEVLRYREGVARAYFNLGLVYQTFGDHLSALENLENALELERSYKNPERAGVVLKQIARIYLEMNNFQESVAYYEAAIEMLDEAGLMEIKLTALSNLGEASFRAGDYDSALDYYREVIQHTLETGNFEHVRMMAVANIGYTLAQTGAYQRAEEYLLQSKRYFDQGKFAMEFAEINIYLAELYISLNRNDAALETGYQALETANRLDHLPFIMQASKLISTIYEAQGDHDQALVYYKKYHEVLEELLDHERMERVAKRQIRFDLEHTNRELALLNEKAAVQAAELRQQELWRRYLITALVLIGFIGLLLFRNIQVKKKSNRLLREQAAQIEVKNRQLMKLNSEKDEFLEIAAHDLRNPLSSIVGVVNLMDDEEEKDEDRQLYIQLIRMSTERMLNLITNYLNVNAIDQGFKSDKVEPVEIRRPLEQVVAHFRKPAAEKQIRLTAALDDSDSLVLTDVDIFQRIVENLVSNAIKFSPLGSTVEIKTKASNRFMEISVSDNGPGIKKEDQHKLFRRFAKLSNRPTGKESSTGLGLYIVKKLSESMGGSIRCESEPGKGSTFTVALPAVTHGSMARTELQSHV